MTPRTQHSTSSARPVHQVDARGQWLRDHRLLGECLGVIGVAIRYNTLAHRAEVRRGDDPWIPMTDRLEADIKLRIPARVRLPGQ